MGVWAFGPMGPLDGPRWTPKILRFNFVILDFYGFNLWHTVIGNALYQLFGNLDLLGKDICVLKFEKNPKI